MAMALVKSKWESGNLVFRTKAAGTLICTIAPEGFREYLTVTDIDATNGTLSAAALAGGIIVHTSVTGAGTLTFDTAVNILAAFPGIATGDVITCYLINDGDQTVTLAVAAGTTIADTGQTLAINESCILVILVTSSTTVTVYTIGA